MSYIDDFMVMACMKEEACYVHDKFISLMLDVLGWLWEETKGKWEPTQVAKVLGLVVDLKRGDLPL
jgi:hypothetical protein